MDFLCAFRAQLRLARDDPRGALRDYAHALEALRDQSEDADLEAVTVCARVAVATDRRAEAADLVAKIFTFAWKPPYGNGGVVELALLLGEVGRSADPIVEAAQALPGLPWLQAASAVTRGELESAADQLAELCCPPLESEVRIRLAERLLTEGRRGEADDQLRRALAFWRSVGATRYIREGEALLTATA